MRYYLTVLRKYLACWELSPMRCAEIVRDIIDKVYARNEGRSNMRCGRFGEASSSIRQF